MADQNTKRIGTNKRAAVATRMHTLQDTWRVMKPFVRFSVKAIKLLGQSLIFIVKNIPKPEEHKHEGKNDKVIKI